MIVTIKFINNRLVLTNNMNDTTANVTLTGIKPTQFDLLGVELFKTYHERSSDRCDTSVARFKIHALDSVKRYTVFVTTQLKKKGIDIRPNLALVVLSDIDYNFFKLYRARMVISEVEAKRITKPDLVYTMGDSINRGVIND